MNKILIIEDDPAVRENLCEILENEGFLFECADNGKKGLELALKIIPDLIISDIMMPVMNGYDLIQKLLENPKTASIPVIFLTARVEPSDLRRGMNLGADDYIMKPFKIDELLNAISIRLKKKQINDERVNDIKKNLSTKIPHELRTPLVPIIGYSDLIQDEDDIGQIKSMAKTIKKSGKLLHRKIEKFLTYKDLIIGNNHDSDNNIEVEITEITEELLLGWLTGLDEDLRAINRVQLIVVRHPLNISAKYLGIIITELVENALKYSPRESTVQLEGTVADNFYTIKIFDEGRGLTDSEIKKISAFEKFGKESFTETGLGLGLALAFKAAEMLGANITLNSVPEKHTIVNINFPLK